MLSPHPIHHGAVIIAPDDVPKIDRRCPMLVKISKDLNEGKLHLAPDPAQPHCPCRCPHPILGEIRTYSVDYRAVFPFMSSNIKCDEVRRAQMLDGCYMEVRGNMKLKESKCPPHEHDGKQHDDLELYVGCQTGDFLIFRPIDPNDLSAGHVPVFRGDLHGTVGFDPKPCKENWHPRCCHENHTRGMMVGKGVGVLEDCTICVTYDGQLHSIDDLNLCGHHDIGWSMCLDGTVCCPCPPYEEERDREG